MFDDLFGNRLHHLHLDFHTPEYPARAIKAFDAKATIATIADAGINAVKVFAKDHYGNSYYNTAIGHKHAGLKEDMLGDMVREAKQRDIAVIAYYSICCDYRDATVNPDWSQRDIDGNALSVAGFWRDICLNSPCRFEVMYPQMREIIANYDVAGFWLDMIYFLPNGCYCDYCKSLFAATYGRPLVGADAETIRKFQHHTMRTFFLETRQVLDESGKKLALMANGAGFLPQQRPPLMHHIMGREAADVVDCHVAEAQPAWDGYASLSAQARFLRTLGKPFEILSVRFIAHWGEWTFKPVTQLKHEFSTILANGGVVSCGDQPYEDGTLDPQAYKNIGEAFAFIAEREPFIKGAVTVRHTAVLNHHNNYKSTYGATKALVELHQQFDIIDLEGLEQLDHYQVLIMESVGPLDAKAHDAIWRFVERGGLLIAAHDAPFDGLGDVLGVSKAGLDVYEGGYVKDVLGYPIFLKHRAMNVRPTSARIVSQWIHPITHVVPHRSFSHLHAPPGEASGYPFMTVNSFGQGKAVYLSVPVLGVLWDTQHHPVRLLYGEILNRYAPSYIATDAPSSVEINVMSRGRELVVNFVNFHCERPSWTGYPYIDQIPPAHDVHFALRADSPKQVVLEPGSQSLDFQFNDGFVHVTIPKIHVYELLRLIY
jgi:hypothetical protein